MTSDDKSTSFSALFRWDTRTHIAKGKEGRGDGWWAASTTHLHAKGKEDRGEGWWAASTTRLHAKGKEDRGEGWWAASTTRLHAKLW